MKNFKKAAIATKKIRKIRHLIRSANAYPLLIEVGNGPKNFGGSNRKSNTARLPFKLGRLHFEESVNKEFLHELANERADRQMAEKC